MNKIVLLILCLSLSMMASAQERGARKETIQNTLPVLIVKIKPQKCPFCGDQPIGTIVWGTPHMTSDLNTKIKAGDVVLGGCERPENPPTWKCAHCGAEFFEESKAKVLEIQKNQVTQAIQNNIQTYQKQTKE